MATPATTTSSGADAFLRFGSGTGLAHLPALDGLRGLAVVAVVLFHADFDWAKGGFLGVSLFFTLSGFLITSLLIAEHRRDDRVDLLAFWGRRFRRLLPAAWLTLAAVTIAAISLDEFTGSSRIDVWAALANVANWRFLTAGSSYNDLFSAPSPVLHFWSLAIEEQCYVVLPVVVGIVLHFSKRSLRALTAALGLLLAASVLSTVLIATADGTGGDRVYYGTDTRAAELLIGALLAVAVAHEPFRRRVTLSLWSRWSVHIGGAVALVATVAAWRFVAVSDTVVGNGGLVAIGVASGALVLNCAVGVGPIATVLRTAPLRYLGKISYGIYLFHWPVFVFANERRMGLERLPRLGLQIAVVLVLAALSHQWFEQPLRRGTLRIARLSVNRLAPVAIVVVVGLTLLPGGVSSANTGFDADAAKAQLQEIQSDQSIPASTTAPQSPAEVETVPPPRFAVFGDSVALSLAFPVAEWSRNSGAATFVGGEAELGCGIGRGGRQRAFGDADRTERCDTWQDRWTTAINGQRPDLAMVQSAQWELVPRQLEGDSTWRTLGDPLYDAYLLNEFLAANDVLAAQGALVIWITFPHYSQLDDDSLPQPMRDSHDPILVDRLNALIREVVAQRPETSRIMDLATWMEPRLDDVTLRKDGAHFNDTGALAVAEQFVGPQMTSLWEDWYRRG